MIAGCKMQPDFLILSVYGLSILYIQIQNKKGRKNNGKNN